MALNCRYKQRYFAGPRPQKYLNYDGSVFLTGTSSYTIPTIPLTDVREYLQQAQTTKNRIERSSYAVCLLYSSFLPNQKAVLQYSFLI